MQLIDVPTIELADWREKVHLHHFTDIHMGEEGCDEKRLTKDIEQIQESTRRGEKHIWLIGGDSICGIGPRDPRHDNTSIAERFQKYAGKDLFRRQVIAVARAFEPIREHGILVGAGNHENSASKHGEYDPAADLAEKLNLPYAGYSAGFRLKLDPQNNNTSAAVLGYWHHGWGGGRTKGAKANLGMKLRDIINVDLYFTGHVHEPVLIPEEELSLPRRGKLRLKAREKLIVVGATYLKSHPTIQEPQVDGKYDTERDVKYDYAERSGFKPTVIGHVGCTLQMARTGGKKNERWGVKLRAQDFR